MNSFNIYTIHCLSNLHVGSGDITYDIVDNKVQRDSATDHPVINSSSLKGALRELFTYKCENKGNLIQHVFGSETKEQDENKKGKPGKYTFLQANLLSIPVRSNARPYFMATCPAIIKEFIKNLRTFAHPIPLALDSLTTIDPPADHAFYFNEISLPDNEPVYFEDIQGEKFPIAKEKLTKFEEVFGENMVILPDSYFTEYVNESLPVVARNCLENGESKNLWYEEVVPRESRFYCAVGQDGQYIKTFNECLTQNFIQIGANASVGYGLCSISSLTLLGEKNEPKEN